MKIVLSLAMLITLVATSLRAQETPATCIFGGKELLETKRLAATGKPEAVAQLKDFRKEADKRLKDKLWTVTDKTLLAPSGDNHDYVSIATYYWPNPKSTNGLPYVVRDGEANPEKKNYDAPRFGQMIHAVRAFSIAYYMTGEEKYANRAAQQIRAWFLDEETRMNPHVRHSQLKKGTNTGSPVGIIDVRDLPQVIDAVALLKGSRAWTAGDESKLQKWFSEYLAWLTTSDFARSEGAATNNHGTWYDVQAAAIALYTGNASQAREICESAKTNRIAMQIEPDGQQPRELARTLSQTYTIFNLEAFFNLARIGELAGVDLWNYRTADGRSIRAALDWTLPYATGKKKWEHKQIKDTGARVLIPLLHQAAVAYNEPAYEKMITEITGTSARRNAESDRKK